MVNVREAGNQFFPWPDIVWLLAASVSGLVLVGHAFCAASGSSCPSLSNLHSTSCVALVGLKVHIDERRGIR